MLRHRGIVDLRPLIPAEEGEVERGEERDLEEKCQGDVAAEGTFSPALAVMAGLVPAIDVPPLRRGGRGWPGQARP